MNNLVTHYDNFNDRVEIAVRSVIGTRNKQQDNACVLTDHDCVFAALCDGMGGLENGGEASELAIQTFEEQYRKHDGKDYRAFLADCLRRADSAIYLHSKARSGTTAVMFVLHKLSLYWASVGDSRLYILRGNEIIQATRDHNYGLRLKTMLESGNISKETYEKEMVKGEALISYLGMGGIRLLDLTTVPMELRPDDLLLLCSDGLTRILSDCQIADCLNRDGAKSLKEAAEMLITNAQSAGRGKPMDNTTFIVIKVH